MLYARARLRYLAALGLPSIAIPLYACSGGSGSTATSPSATPTTEATVAVATDSAAATTSASAATSATSTETATASATPTSTSKSGKGVHTGSWIVEKEPPTGPMRPGRPMCPNGLFCVPQPASIGSAAPAAAPYAACANEVQVPADLPAIQSATHTEFDPATTGKERKGDPAACCYSWVRLCPGGRPLRGDAGDLVADSMSRGDWLARLEGVSVAEIPAGVRAEVAAHYRREAAFEHASIAAFARAAMALLAAGAPASLVADTHAAAIDEVEHARVAFALASLFGGAEVGPAPLDLKGQKPLPGSLAELAVETFVDACVGESVAALALRVAAAGAAPAIGALLSGIAEDEERHAALAWRTVAWALQAGGGEVREALEGALETAMREAEIESAGEVESRGAESRGAESRGAASGLGAYGLLGGEATRLVRIQALREVVAPCARAMLAADARPRAALSVGFERSGVASLA